MKNTFLIALLSFICFTAQGQVSYLDLGNGSYDYSSGFSTDGLHFYMYGDGYYSFDQSPQHRYGGDVTPTNPADVRYFQSDPYDGVRPTRHLVHNPNNGTVISTPPAYILPNQVSLLRSWNLVEGEENYFVLSFENQSQSPISSGCIEFHFDEKFTLPNLNEIEIDNDSSWLTNILPTESPSGYSDYNKKLTWAFTDLQPNEQRFIYIPADCDAPSMSRVDVRAVMKINSCGSAPPIPGDPIADGNDPYVFNSPVYTLTSRVRNHPKDPNYIISDPLSLHHQNVEQTIRYKIYFQNEGDDPAENVYLDYLIEAPFYNVTLVDASHACGLEWTPMPNETDFGEVIEIDFYDINLPGMIEPDPSPTYDSTIGWVEFDVCYDLKVFSILGLDCIDSQVDIVFDSVAPEIATYEICRDQIGNSTSQPTPVSHLLYTCSPIIAPSQDIGEANRVVTNLDNVDSGNILLAPNPAINTIDVLNVEPKKIRKIVIYNSRLEVVKTISEQINKINISDLKTGLYYLSLQTDDKKSSHKFIKI